MLRGRVRGQSSAGVRGERLCPSPRGPATARPPPLPPPPASPPPLRRPRAVALTRPRSRGGGRRSGRGAGGRRPGSRPPPPRRLDILHAVAMWQKNFKRISYAKVKTRAEVRGGGRKPWRQKGTGRSRQGSIRSPLWRGGGIAHGPRGPTSYFYMLPMKVRVMGLKVALTVKLMQDNLHIVDSLEMPTADPQYLVELARYRHWGQSVLIVDVNEMPENIENATASLKTITLIPALGLNVHSMLKHHTLVLTLDTVAFLEKKLLWHDTRYSALYPFSMPYSDFP
ncbi:large ribosomal subunit protein uL4m isoform X2 [Struthio camelus]|uniref:large ribosomal subunit protein uL4m isoform X2 n=1 Tax=Struthio camelus TaxID=8801 RepID=UPI003603FC8C